VIALAIIIERVVVLFFSAPINKDGFLRGLKKHIYAGDLDKAINYVAGQKSTPLTNVVKAGLMNVPKGEDEVQAALDEASLRRRPSSRRARLPGDARERGDARRTPRHGERSDPVLRAVAHVNPADKATILSQGISRR
jgi:hypothetical protein